MHFSTVEDVLVWSTEVYARLARTLGANLPEQDSDRAILLRRQQAEQCWEQERGLARYRQTAAADLLATELHRKADMSPANEVEARLKQLPLADADALGEAVTALHGDLAALYETYSGNEGPARMAELFESMADRERREQKRVSLSLQDV